MNDALFAELLNNPETEILDFKKTFYDFSNSGKGDAGFLKDLISMSNTIREQTAHLIFGIKLLPNGDKVYHGISEIMDDAALQEKARSKISPAPKFKSYIYTYRELKYGIIEIPVHPHEKYLSVPVNQSNTLMANRVYLRRGSMNDEAQPQEIKLLYKWLKKVRKQQAPPPPKPENDDYDGYLLRTVTPSSGDSIAQLLLDHDTLEKVLTQHTRIALLGWGLSGKSTELIRLAHVLSQKPSIHAHRIIFGHHFNGPIHKRIPQIDRIPSDQLYVLLDGLDEIRGKNRKETIDAILQFAEGYPKSRIIVSCRTNFYTTDSENSAYNTLTDFSSYKLDPLANQEIEKYLDKHLGQNKKDFLLEVNRKKISDLLHAPYYLVKLVQQFRNGHQIADSKGKLFESEIFDLIRMDVGKLKPEERAPYELALFKLFTKAAFVMEAKGTNQVSSSDLHLILPDKKDYRKVLKAGNLFQGTDDKSKVFKFTHNNAQEYLAAKVLAQLKFKKIKEIIGVEPDFDRIKPSWVNTLAFVIDILPEKAALINTIFNWLAKENKDLLIALDSKKMPDQLKFDLFSGIFVQFKNERRRINRQIYRYEDLASFSESEQIFDYLLAELDSGDSISKMNALTIANFYHLKAYPNYRKLFRLRYECILEGNEAELHASALAGFGGLFDISAAAFLKVFKKFKTSEDTWVRYQLFTLIWITGHQDLVVGYLLEQARFLQADEMPRLNKRQGSNRLSNEFTEVSNALQRVHTAAGLTELFNSGPTDFSRFAYSVYFSKVYEPTLEKAKAYTEDESLSKAIRQTFIAHHSEILQKSNFNKAFLSYFSAAGQLDLVVKEMIVTRRYRDYSLVRTVAILGTTVFVDFLVLELEAGRIDQQTIEDIHQQMDLQNNVNADYIRVAFSLNEIPRRPQRQMPGMEEVQARDLAAIFDQSVMLSEIEMIFQAFGKDTLTTDDRYNDIVADFWSTDFSGIARDIIDLRGENHTVSLQDVTREVLTDFELRLPNRLHDYLLHHPQAKLTTDQWQPIFAWCDQAATTVNFREAISWTPYGGWIMDKTSEIFSFFIRYLDIRKYPNALYEDMLNTFRWDDQLIEIIPFVQSVIGFETTAEAILTNMTLQVPGQKLLDDYVKFMETHDVKRAVPLFRVYLLDGTVKDDYQLLNAYLRLGGNLEMLRPLLETSTSYFLQALIEKFITAGSPTIKKTLLQKAAEESNPEEKLTFIRFLVKLQHKAAVEDYVAVLRAKGYSPDDSSPSNPLYRLNKPKFTRYALELYELAQQPSFYADTFCDLRSISGTILQHIALYRDNFPKVRKKVEKWLKKRQEMAKKGQPIPENFIQGLTYLMENNAKQFEANSVKMASQESAIRLYDKISGAS